MLYIGTASWTDPSLIRSKRFYPRGCSSAESRLRFYATRFNSVEVDSAYYALPSAANAAKWVERSPAAFRFSVKAFRLFTGHQTPEAQLPRDIAQTLVSHFRTHRNLYWKDTPAEVRDELWRRYLIGIEPLVAAGRLLCLHFQLAPWVARTEAGIAMVLDARRRLPGARVSIEFRNHTWLDPAHADDTLALLREHSLAHTVVDEPQGFSNSVPAVWAVTDPRLAVVRLHGRNAAAWNVKGTSVASDRFNYDYSDGELAAVAPRIAALDAEDVSVVFNNNHEDQGQRNATTLMALLDAGAPGR